MTRTKPEDEDKAQRAVQSVEVGGRLLLALAAHGAPMSLKDLAAGAGLPSSRAHPYLVSFGKLGLVEQDGASGRYLLGPAALQLGLAALHQLDAVRSATPVAEALARETGHAVGLAVWGNFGPTVIRMIDASEPLHVAMRAGTVMSILGTATGRAFAAYLARERLERAMAGPLG
ncbi:MAG TPA: helix-turn-helix domain-containing protein, partial [Burkholderiaceae bacterium]